MPMPPTRHVALMATVSAALVGCLLTSDLHRLDREQAGDADADRADATSTEASAPGACPEDMVVIPRPSGGAFCIDAFEVSVATYRGFLEKADTGRQPSVCAWNTTFTPSKLDLCASFDPTTAPPADPIRCVDWCDAAAFCASAGKRLCGRLDGSTGTNPLRDGDHATSEWHQACSGTAGTAFPYGDTLDAPKCIDTSDRPNNVTTPGCEGGYPGVHHMSGNVAEWDDACLETSNPAMDSCRARGGAFWAGNASIAAENDLLRCDRPQSSARSGASNDRGIRCCKTP